MGDDVIFALVFLAVVIFYAYNDMKRTNKQANRQHDAHISDQGWGSFDANDGGDGPDYGGF